MVTHCCNTEGNKKIEKLDFKITHIFIFEVMDCQTQFPHLNFMASTCQILTLIMLPQQCDQGVSWGPHRGSNPWLLGHPPTPAPGGHCLGGEGFPRPTLAPEEETSLWSSSSSLAGVNIEFSNFRNMWQTGTSARVYYLARFNQWWAWLTG